MFYIVMEKTGKIVDQFATMTDERIQDAANIFGGAVYAIEGQHSGYYAEPSKPEAKPDAQQVTPDMASPQRISIYGYTFTVEP